MKTNISIATALVALSTSVALAGEPFQQTVTCPIGGQEFEITSTYSCSSRGANMMLGSITTCDFVTKLPVCPDNGLPMYKTFTEADIERLRPFLGTERYAAISRLSAGLRAYEISKILDPDDISPFNLLLSAYRLDHSAFGADPKWLDEWAAVSDVFFEQIEPKDVPFYQAIIAFAHAAQGRQGETRAWIDRIDLSVVDNADYLRSYIQEIERCLIDMSQDRCSPDDQWPREDFPIIKLGK